MDSRAVRDRLLGLRPRRSLLRHACSTRRSHLLAHCLRRMCLQPPMLLGAVFGTYGSNGTLWAHACLLAFWREAVQSGDYAHCIYFYSAFVFFGIPSFKWAR